MERHQSQEIKRFRVRVAVYLAILSLVVIGLAYLGHVGWATGVLLIAGPALWYTAVKSAEGIRENLPMPTGEKIVTFVSAGCVVAAIPLTVVALMIALLGFCAAAGRLGF